MYKACYVCDDKVLFTKDFPEIPCVGDEVRLIDANGDKTFYRVIERVFCLDTLASTSSTLVNIKIAIVT